MTSTFFKRDSIDSYFSVPMEAKYVFQIGYVVHAKEKRTDEALKTSLIDLSSERLDEDRFSESCLNVLLNS